jgi:hypothetical protein
MDAGMVGGLIGAVVGIVGGCIGTYFSVRNTAGPRERGFVIRAATIAWAGVCAFLAGLFLLPTPYNLLLWIPYTIVLPVAIIRLNRRQAELRREEAR